MIYRSEYPRPQMVRDSWQNLNGEWDFEIDNGLSGKDRGLIAATKLSGKINVPFCPESKLSGVEHRDFMNAVWYKRTVVFKKRENKRIIFHIDACDYIAELFVNGQSAGRHYGGSTPVVLDITELVNDGENIITICAEDDIRSGNQPAGKQSTIYNSHGCDYTRTTGIWQTVWFEEVPDAYISEIKFTPNANDGKVDCEIFCENANGKTLSLETFFEAIPTGSATAVVCGRVARISIALSEIHLWEVGKGLLYDVKLTLDDDKVTSYFGLRDVHYDGKWLILNGKRVFQRLVLDQGFYPDGIWTAPSDDELKNDILRSMAMGFNGARLHQKVFEPRFLYHCDKLGYIVWGEHGNWGLDISRSTAWAGFIPEWLEILRRDYSHPSIIGWCPLNETSSTQDKRFVKFLYDLTRSFDPYRMFIDCSGYIHVKTEVIDFHDYEQDPEKMRACYEPLPEGKSPLKKEWRTDEFVSPEVSFISEYGGLGYSPKNSQFVTHSNVSNEFNVETSTEKDAWCYGDAESEESKFIERFKGLTDTLLDNPCITAFCYTQLTDIEQEQNGLYTYDRRAKFAPEIIHSIVSRKAVDED